jgi:hypothetical protein
VPASRRSGIVRQNDRVTTWQEWDAETVMNSELPTIPERERPAGLWVPLARWWDHQDRTAPAPHDRDYAGCFQGYPISVVAFIAPDSKNSGSLAQVVAVVESVSRRG